MSFLLDRKISSFLKVELRAEREESCEDDAMWFGRTATSQRGKKIKSQQIDP